MVGQLTTERFNQILNRFRRTAGPFVFLVNLQGLKSQTRGGIIPTVEGLNILAKLAEIEHFYCLALARMTNKWEAHTAQVR
jgi:hypothetical protein